VEVVRWLGRSFAVGVSDLVVGSAALLLHASRLQTVDSPVGRASAPGFTLAACRAYRAARHACAAILQIDRSLAGASCSGLGAFKKTTLFVEFD
jgi:16S rRNA C967 or C1407 C5-methylase (RsmB/RsmF family)